MKNKHVELVKKWLADKNSVSHAELRVNANAAYAAPDAAYSVAHAAAYAAVNDRPNAVIWVKQFEGSTK